MSNDFVVFPKEFEQQIMNTGQTSETTQPTNNPMLREMLDTPTVIEEPVPSTSKAAEDMEVSVEKPTKVPKLKAKKMSENERLHRVGKMALLLARNDAYNDELEIRNRFGEFIPGSNVMDFLKLATQRNRVVEGFENYIFELSKIKDQVRDLITNKSIIDYLDFVDQQNRFEATSLPSILPGKLLKKGRKKNLESPDQQPEATPSPSILPGKLLKKGKKKKPESPDEQTEATPSPSTFPGDLPEKGRKRKHESPDSPMDLSLGTTVSPKRDQTGSGSELVFPEWDKLPDLNAEASKFFEDLVRDVTR